MRDFTGDKCGRWSVEGPYRSSGHGREWWCICDCGQTKWVLESILKKTNSGCRKCINEANARIQTKHGLSSDIRFSRYQTMVTRCHDPNSKNFATYGARGIRVCDRWRHGEGGMTGYECYLEDMDPPKTSGWHLHRADNDKGYEPGNCVWLTNSEHSKAHGAGQRPQSAAREPKKSMREVGRRMGREDMTYSGGHSKGGERA